jgi:hypothetical protein
MPIVMSEQLAAHYCPIQLTAADKGTADRPVPLVTTFLWSQRRPQDKEFMRFVLHIRILSLRQRGGVFHFDDHIEQTADFDDILVVDIKQRDAGLLSWAKWNSEITTSVRDYEPPEEERPLADLDATTGAWQSLVPMPASAHFLGDKAQVLLTATPATA